MFTTATYSPEDNKLRLYFSSRLESDLFERVKAQGFKWAPKQELFVAPSWTPAREDFCIELAGEIEPEQTTMIERAEAKIERLEGAARKAEERSNGFHVAANAISKRFEFGQPILVGHHSERKARKDQERINNNMKNAVQEIDKIQHYNWKIRGVAAHANSKASRRTRLNRIKTLLAELRDLQRTLNTAQRNLKLLNQINTIEDKEKRENAISIYAGGTFVSVNLYFDLRNGKITHEEAITKCIENNNLIINSPTRKRWILHTLNRLGYERAELGPIVRFEGDITPAILQVFVRTHGADKPKASCDGENWKVVSSVDLPLHIGGGEKEISLTSSEWCELMQDTGYEVPAAGPKKPPILNFKAESIEVGRYGKAYLYQQIEMTKEEYSNLYEERRWVELSSCCTFRVKVCLDPNVRGYGAKRLAVFLTDSKVHPSPDSNSVVLSGVKADA
ncbi:DUF3560 domain-containing protein [Kiloniella laminariae]|uniref:DUF3560 domain-containing protein n=1 Tax=Kiloniella laminariae TaxID=454162 RepID=A0ABT4LPZ4_9PROT|nr:DUF3560 domain-containing protein [Kiloniella laminariae]MCZ4283101.1 DUF3560 domain-containing protein [Kiloniella laminariae]